MLQGRYHTRSKKGMYMARDLLEGRATRFIIGQFTVQGKRYIGREQESYVNDQ